MLCKNTYVMNKKTGKTYMVTTDTYQTRNRRQVKDCRTNNPTTFQIAESKLVALTPFEAQIAVAGEKIERGKMAMSLDESFTMKMYRDLKKKVMG